MQKITKRKNIIFTFSIVAMIIMLLIPSYAIATITPGDYDPSNNRPSRADVDKIVGIANPLIGTIKVVGIVIAVITLAVLGIKYMMGSVAEKASYKKSMIPYLIGAFMVVAITQLLGVLIELIININ